MAVLYCKIKGTVYNKLHCRRPLDRSFSYFCSFFLSFFCVFLLFFSFFFHVFLVLSLLSRQFLSLSFQLKNGGCFTDITRRYFLTCVFTRSYFFVSFFFFFTFLLSSNRTTLRHTFHYYLFLSRCVIRFLHIRNQNVISVQYAVLLLTLVGLILK